MPSIVNIQGVRIALGPIEAAQAETVQRWWNDFAITRNLHALPRPRTLDEVRAMFAPGGFFNKPTSVAFGIYAASDGALIGTAGLLDIEHEHKVGEYFILIGETDRHGQGLGTEAARLTLAYAFNVLGLVNVMLRVSEFNAGAIRSYEKAGFVAFGRRSRCHFVDGRHWDTVYMEATPG